MGVTQRPPPFASTGKPAAAAAGRRRARGADTAEAPARPCDWRDCGEPGPYRAPRTRPDARPWYHDRAPTPEDFHWFCLEHVRAYNLAWDYFRGMDGDAIDAFRADALRGHQPTWQRWGTTAGAGASMGSAPGIGESAADYFAHTLPPWMHARGMAGGASGDVSGGVSRAADALPPTLPRPTREALALLNLAYPFTRAELKRCYYALVKQTHPDRTNNDKAAEARFKEITLAYRHLLATL